MIFIEVRDQGQGHPGRAYTKSILLIAQALREAFSRPTDIQKVSIQKMTGASS